MLRHLFILLTTLFTLSACASNVSPEKRPACNRLRANLIFSGSTSLMRDQNQQRAEQPLQRRDFDAYNCPPTP
jgi:hypothetical protein